LASAAGRPSSSTATIRTTARVWVLPARSIAPGWMRSATTASARVDHPRPSSPYAFRSATRSIPFDTLDEFFTKNLA
jgi:hypothetical protein